MIAGETIYITLIFVMNLDNMGMGNLTEILVYSKVDIQYKLQQHNLNLESCLLNIFHFFLSMPRNILHYLTFQFFDFECSV
jgi:hypothetical protein